MKQPVSGNGIQKGGDELPNIQSFGSYITASCMNFGSGMKNGDGVVLVLIYIHN